MTDKISMMFPDILQLAEHRQSRVLLICASKLELGLIPELYDLLMQMGHCEKLDVILYGTGGEINATRRVGLLLNKFCDHLTFIVPHYCQSAFTLLALSGRDIVSGELAIFSPIDPGLSTHTPVEGTPNNLSSEDIRLFFQMTEQWFDIKDIDSKQQLLSGLMGSIFPPNLTALYRSNLEQRAIAEELVTINQPDNVHVVEKLMQGFHSHHFALSGCDLKQMGLRVNRDSQTEHLAWQIAKKIDGVLGSRAMQSIEDPLTDTIIATENVMKVRQRQPHVPAPKWLEVTWN